MIGSLTMIERMLCNCPETDSSDTERYPILDEEHLLDMNLEYMGDPSIVHVFGYVREDNRQIPYVDLYFFDCMNSPEYCTRFIIQEGQCLPENDLELLLSYTRDSDLSINMECLVNMEQMLKKRQPNWYISLIDSSHIGEEIEHIYFVSHRSGCREILYKARLDIIAYNIDDVIQCNLIGRTPEEILGLPMKLLRILNTPELVSVLFYEDSLKESAGVYYKYASYLGKDLPNYVQWEYLRELYRNQGTLWGIEFNRKIYSQLVYVNNKEWLELFEKYFELKKMFPQWKKKKIPSLNNLIPAIAHMENIIKFKTKEQELNPMIRSRKKYQRYFEFESDGFIILLPQNGMDMCREAVYQHNCLMDYIEEHANGDTTILFLRKTQDPDIPFVTIEVNSEGDIRQLYSRFNNLPDVKVFLFIEIYALIKNFNFNPEEVIMREIDEDMEIDNELWDYLEDYHRRQKKYVCANDQTISEERQMTLQEYFPDIFVS